MNTLPTSLQSPRLLLRKIVDSDIENIYKGLSHPLVIKHYGVSYDSLEATQEQMEWFADPKQCWWAICSAETKEFMGAGGFNDISTEHKKAEIGLWLLPEYWGKGFMKEAMPMISKYGLEELGLHRIEGFVDSKNENCKRAMAKLDFVHEGTMKDCEMKDGLFLSTEIYAKLNI